MRQILLKILFCFNLFAFSQSHANFSDSIPGWFRFEKNSHSVALMPTYIFGLNEMSSHTNETLKMNVLGFYSNYNYFPIRRLGIGLNVMASRAFSSPNNDYNNFGSAIELKYIIKGENRYFFYPFMDYGMIGYSYYTNKVYTWANQDGDIPDGRFIRKFYPSMRFGAGFGTNIYNNMTFNLFYSYTHILNENAPKLLRNQNIFFSFHYHFNRSPQLPRLKYNELKLGKTIKSWF